MIAAGVILALLAYVYLSFMLDATAYIPGDEAEALGRESGYRHGDEVLGHRGGFESYRALYRLEGDATVAARIAAGYGAVALGGSRWDQCLGLEGPWWWRREPDALGDCYQGASAEDRSWARVHHDRAEGVITVLYVDD